MTYQNLDQQRAHEAAEQFDRARQDTTCQNCLQSDCVCEWIDGPFTGHRNQDLAEYILADADNLQRFALMKSTCGKIFRVVGKCDGQLVIDEI